VTCGSSECVRRCGGAVPRVRDGACRVGTTARSGSGATWTRASSRRFFMRAGAAARGMSAATGVRQVAGLVGRGAQPVHGPLMERLVTRL